jgi:apolipoprotein N-acyltransferase
VADVRSASTAFRAIENRVAMVKADVVWDSVIVAPNGRVITSTAVHSERGDSALLVADIPMGPRGAPFTSLSGAPFRWLEWAVTLAMLGVLVLKKVRGRKRPLTCWVADGTRTRDSQDHNLVLYQLNYSHHCRKPARRY